MKDAAEKEVPAKFEEDAIAKKENVKPGTGRPPLSSLLASTDATHYRIEETTEVPSCINGQKGQE